jgi:GMP reductase|tara:strand:+ start:2305 stop:3339 length:1035 start_codon:yes stop_codon:yes gene_type:complete
MRIENDIKLDFKDVLIRPKRSELSSRSEVVLDRNFKVNENDEYNWVGIPIVASNMDTTGTIEIAKILREFKLLTFLHKHYEVEDLYNIFFEPQEYVGYSMGITDLDVKKWEQLQSKLPVGNIKWVCIDVANGYTERFIEFVKDFKEANPSIRLVAGNVVTGDITEQLILAGADVVKVGIGPGSVCTTRIQTGVGYPQLSSIIECADAAHGLGGRIMADGGCTCPGDVAKAFGANADFVMIGGMFAGHEESGGETITENGELYKVFYGMSSDTAMEKYAGGVAEYRSSEGKTVKIPFRGSIANTVQSLLGGLRSSCTYVGARELRELSKCTTFVRVNETHNKVFE